MNIKEHAQEQQGYMSSVLNGLANAALEMDSINEIGTCTSAYMEYDEQDCFNAVTIFMHVICSYGIHHGYITDENATDFGNKVKNLCKKCGIDTWQEATVKQMLNNI